MKALLVALCVMGVTATAQADTKQKLVTVTKVADGSTASVGVLNAATGALTGMYITQSDGKDLSYTLAQIAKPEGVVLNVTSGMKVLILQGAVDARTQEGTMTLKYLNNALIGAYKSCNFILRKDASGYFIENAYTHEKPVTAIRILSSPTGVTNLEGICPRR